MDGTRLKPFSTAAPAPDAQNTGDTARTMNTYTFTIRGTPHAEGLPLSTQVTASSLPAALAKLGRQVDGPARKILHRYGGSVTIRLTGITNGTSATGDPKEETP